MIQDGETLLRELDRQNFPVDAMFSLNAPEEGYWRLIIGSPFVEEQGTRAGYQRLREIYAELDLQGLALRDISLLDPTFLDRLNDWIEIWGRGTKRNPLPVLRTSLNLIM